MSKDSNRKKQRALVFQGGVALGAYEAGVFKAFYKRFFKPDESLFDVIAGTSIGAINASIIVSYVKENRTWENSADRLEEFWHYISQSTPATAKLLTTWWSEAARRYYSVKDFFISGVDRVFSSPSIEYDFRFFDNLPIYEGFPNTSNNIWSHYNNNALRESLEYVGEDGKNRFANFPIATSFDSKDKFVEPRLLTVCVDVQLGSVVTFDSYEYVGRECKICGESIVQDGQPYSRKELIKHLTKIHPDSQPNLDLGKQQESPLRWSVYNDGEKKIVLYYNNGLELKNVMASASFPVYFNYEDIEGRKFWDGGILSNTPLRELIQCHRDYWYKQRREMQVPNLDVFIVNIWPSKIESVPYDHDGVKSRKNDITFADKTDYDQRVAALVTDYLELYEKTRDIAANYVDPSNRDAFKKDLDDLLSSTETPRSKKRSGESRYYKDLIDGRFKIMKIVTVERRDDEHGISNKWADFTSDTIDFLIKNGESDANEVLEKEEGIT
jgi:NTE family protein